MDSEEIVLVIVFVLLPAILFPAAVWYLRTNRFRRRVPDSLYQLVIFGRTAIVSKHLLLQLGLILMLYWWMDLFFPFLLTLGLVILVLTVFRITKAHRVDSQALSDSSESLLKKLSDMQTEIGDIRQHIKGLGYHIISKQIELDEKDQLREKLEQEIAQKSSEAEFWSSLTEEQKQVVSEAAISAIPKEGKGTFWFGVSLGLFINLFATLIWKLLGDPSRNELLSKLEPIFRFFK